MAASYSRLTLAILLTGLGHGACRAEEHTRQVLRHTEAAAQSAGDSAAIREHATEALKHIDAAKAANAGNPAVLKRLEVGEADLRHAVTHAQHYNSTSATAGANDAEQHLEGIKSKDAAPSKTPP